MGDKNSAADVILRQMAEGLNALGVDAPGGSTWATLLETKLSLKRKERESDLELDTSKEGSSEVTAPPESETLPPAQTESAKKRGKKRDKKKRQRERAKARSAPKVSKNLTGDLENAVGENQLQTDFNTPTGNKAPSLMRQERKTRRENLEALLKSMQEDEFWEEPGFGTTIDKVRELFEITETELVQTVKNNRVFVKQLERNRQDLESTVEGLEQTVSQNKTELDTLKNTADTQSQNNSDRNRPEKSKKENSYILRQMMNPSFDTLSVYTQDHATPIGEWVERFKSLVKCIPQENDNLVLYHLENRLEYESIRLPFLREHENGTFTDSKGAYKYLIDTYSTDDVADNLYKDFVSTAQNKTESVDAYSNKRATLVERLEALDIVVRDFEKMFHFKNGMLPNYREKLEALPEYGKMSLPEIVVQMKAFEKSQRTANLSFMSNNSSTQNDSDEPDDAAVVAYLNKHPGKWQKAGTKNSNSEKRYKNKAQFTSKDMKQFYLKDSNGKFDAKGTDDSLWKERIEQKDKKTCPSATAHLYNRDKFNGEKACILCKNLKHTANSCFRLSALKKAGKIK